jgi:predicted nucleotidyltransferase
MSAGEVAAHLIRSCASLAQYEAYMFGSTLRGIGEDIDILVVGPAGAPLAQLKSEMRAAGECLPLHVLYMQPAEERHTRFVTREICVPLVELVTGGGA